ncbi:MAG: FAD-binding protein [Planctomycetales bacterium]|nr:FAD-binding protein [Planctomycetales bacterium]
MAPAPFRPLAPRVLDLLRDAVGESHVLTDPASLERCARDETEDLRALPEAVVRPRSAAEVSAVLRLANEHRFPVVPRGGGTGLSGAAVPHLGGVVLALERMDRILEVDEESLFAVVEPGVVTQTLQEEVEKRGLYYPPDPASRGSCHIGGNLAHNAGGPHAVKYGVTRDWVTGLEAVLPTGEIVAPGGKLLKNVTGYDLVRLLVGSEGTLGVITRATLRLIPLPRFRRLLLAPFADVAAAAATVAAVFRAGVVPSAVEFMERAALRAAEGHLGRSFPGSDAAAVLLLEVDGYAEAEVERQAGVVGETALAGGATDVLLAETPEKQRDCWAIRRCISEAVKKSSVYREVDISVPRARLPEALSAIARVTERHGIPAITYGHAGDGNLHVNLLRRDLGEATWGARLPLAIRDLLRDVVALGGTLTGEHGVGLVQVPWVASVLPAAEIEAYRRVKRALDPNGILNPGKKWPAAAPEVDPRTWGD